MKLIKTQKTLEESCKMNESIAWELAKKTFEESEGYEPNINNKTHELMVACIQEGILTGAKWQAERMDNEAFQWLASKDYLSDDVNILQKEFKQVKKKQNEM